MVAERTDRAILSRLFQKLYQLAPSLDTLAAKGISELPNSAPLYLDVHARHPTYTVIFLAQYYRSSAGDWLPAPEFEMAVYPLRQEAEGLACHEPDGSRRICGRGDTTAADQSDLELNAYLDLWLDQWLKQGYLIIKSDGGADD